MSYGYFPGCSLHGMAKEFDLSVRRCLAGLQMELTEIPDWNCCGASPAHAVNEELALALAVRNLSQAEKHGLDTVVTPCAACYSRFKFANKEIGEDALVLSRIAQVIGQHYSGRVRVKHLVEILAEDLGKIEASVISPLKGMRLACYYGCLLVRPPNVVTFDDSENPVLMDKIVEVLGAEALPWSHKTVCCGAGFAISKPRIVVRLVHAILEAAHLVGADAVVVACPLCHANLDMRQSKVEQSYGQPYRMPIFYLSQLIGLAQGVGYEALGLDRHLVSPKPLLREKKLL